MVPGFDFHSLEYSISACLQNFTTQSTAFLTQQFRAAKQIHFLLRFKHAQINIEEHDYYQSIRINYMKNKSYSERTCRSVVAKWNRFVLTTMSIPYNQQLSQPKQPSWGNFCVGQPLQNETVLYYRRSLNCIINSCFHNRNSLAGGISVLVSAHQQTWNASFSWGTNGVLAVNDPLNEAKSRPWQSSLHRLQPLRNVYKVGKQFWINKLTYPSHSRWHFRLSFKTMSKQYV